MPFVFSCFLVILLLWISYWNTVLQNFCGKKLERSTWINRNVFYFYFNESFSVSIITFSYIFIICFGIGREEVIKEVICLNIEFQLWTSFLYKCIWGSSICWGVKHPLENWHLTTVGTSSAFILGTVDWEREFFFIQDSTTDLLLDFGQVPFPLNASFFPFF